MDCKRSHHGVNEPFCHTIFQAVAILFSLVHQKWEYEKNVENIKKVHFVRVELYFQISLQEIV
jgi:hypothetical protein